MKRILTYRGRPTQVSPKDPDASTKYGFDWTDYLEGETIIGSEWIAEEGLTVEASEFSDTKTSAIVAGGEIPKQYKLTNRVTISGSVGTETEDRTMIVPIREL